MLNTQRIVVIGGTSGIGLAVAKLAAGEGAHVVVASSRKASVDAAVKELGGKLEGRTVDMRSEEAVGELFATVGTFDHLVYTAGEALATSPLSGLDFDEAKAFFEVRFWGALRAVKASLRHLRKSGSIVLTGGSAGRRPMPGWAVPSSICGAAEALTRELAVELAPVRVNIVVPGLVDTGLWRDIDPAALKGLFDATAQKLPVGRIGSPGDIAEHYLAFMRGGYTTGQSIIVDGGGVLV